MADTCFIQPSSFFIQYNSFIKRLAAPFVTGKIWVVKRTKEVLLNGRLYPLSSLKVQSVKLNTVNMSMSRLYQTRAK